VRNKSQTKSEARREWKDHVHWVLTRFKNGHDGGHDAAFWGAVLFCEQTDTPKPGWLRGALEQYAKDRINGAPVKKKEGRRTQWFRDNHIRASVDHWRGQDRPFGLKKKPRPFSYSEAFKKTKEYMAERGINLSVRTIEAAYKRTKKRFSKGEYFGSFEPHTLKPRQ